MIRGPRRGLGTLRSRCRRRRLPSCCWLLFLVMFVLVAVAQPCQAAVRNPLLLPPPPPNPSASPASRYLNPFHQTKAPVNVVVAGHRQQQQQQQQQNRAGYRAASKKNNAQQGSVLRLMSKNYLYLQMFPNGTVGATGHDSSFYCKLYSTKSVKSIHLSRSLVFTHLACLFSIHHIRYL